MPVSPRIGRWTAILAVVLATSASGQTPAPQAPAPSTTPLPAGVLNSSQWRLEQVSANHLKLTGSAAITLSAQSQFFADEVDLYSDTNQLVASGNVVFTSAEGRIAAETVEFNTLTGEGTFHDASGIMSLGAKADKAVFGGQEPDVYFYGETIRKLGPRRYRVTKGGFTTCVQPTPRWEVTSDSVILNLDDYAISRNTVVRVKGVPVFYLPVLYYPIQEDQRATGILMPTYGASTLRGQSISNAFFWAINRSQDATFFHDWFTKTGQGEGAEYRYVAGPQSTGNMRIYRFAQHEASFTSGGQTAVLPAKTSYEFTGTIAQALGGTRRGRLRLDYFSDVLNQQLYHQNIYQASRRSRVIEGGLSDSFGPVSTTLTYQRNETFNGGTSSVLYGATPRLSAILAPQQLLGAPLYASLTSEFAHLPYESLSNGAVTQDNSLSRIDLAPSLRIPLSKLTFLSVNSSVAHRLTRYSRSSDGRGTLVSSALIREYTEVRTDVVGPVFTKIWDPSTSYAERMKHVIEPAFSLGYTTPMSSYKKTPLLTDASDFIVGGTTRLTYGLTNRLFYRGKATNGVKGQTREFVTVGVQQTYYSNTESSQYDTAYASAFRGRKLVSLSPVALSARVSPSARFDANTRVEYDVSGLGLQVWTVGSTMAAGRSSTTLNFSRRHLTATAKPDTYLSSNTSLSSPNGHYAGTYSLDWDVTRSRIVSQRMMGSYMAQCCGLQLDFQKFNFPSLGAGFPVRSDRRINFSLVLAGLGSFSNFFGAFGNTVR